MPPSPRILIVRLSAIGDVIHGIPVACALREHLPQAHIAWMVEGRSADLLRGHQALDEIINVPRGWLKSPAFVWRLRSQLRRPRYDVTIDMQGLTKSALVARIAGAKRRIGFSGWEGRELSTWLNNELVAATKTHVIDRNLELLRPLGILAPAVRFDLPETTADRTTAERAIAERITVERPLRHGFAVINPGAGWPSKLWPRDRFAAVARYLGEREATPSLVVWAGPQERGWAEEIVAGADGHARLAPPTTLTELAAIVRRARLFIASDTGPLHLAAAVGTPCVGLYGPVSAERNGPYGPQHVALQKICLPTRSRQRRTAGPESMEAIGVDDVCQACCRVLAQRERAA